MTAKKMHKSLQTSQRGERDHRIILWVWVSGQILMRCYNNACEGKVMNLEITNLEYSKWKTLLYQILLKKKNQNHYPDLEYKPNILHQPKRLRKRRKTLKSTLEIKLYSSISVLARIYVVPAAIPQKEVCHKTWKGPEKNSLKFWR